MFQGASGLKNSLVSRLASHPLFPPTLAEINAITSDSSRRLPPPLLITFFPADGDRGRSVTPRSHTMSIHRHAQS